MTDTDRRSADNRIKIMGLVPTMRTGGAERVISLLLQQLDRELFEPMLTIVYDREISYVIPDDVPVFVLDREPPVPGTRGLALPPELEERFAGSAAWMGGVADKLARHVENARPDIIISSPMWASILAVVAHDSLPATTRLISRVDAPPSVSLAQSELQDLFTYFVRQNFNKSDRIVAVSRAVGRDLVANFGVDEDRIEVVNNPVDISKIRTLAVEPVEEPWFHDDIPIVVTVGRLERVKGLEFLFRAIAAVARVRPVRLVLVGDGSHRGYLKALSKHLGIEQHVLFVGRQSNPFKYLSNATTFVLSSISEGMPNVLLEAMTCGCPIIATDINGGITREVLDEGTYGLIVPLQDPEALADAILTMLADDALRERFASDGLLRAEAYDLPVVMEHNRELVLAVARMELAGDREPAAEHDLAEHGGPAAPQELAAPGDTDLPADEELEKAIAAEAHPATPQSRSRIGNAITILRRGGLRALGTRLKQEFVGAAAASASGYEHAHPSKTPPRARRQPTDKLRLVVLVPSLDDAFIGSGTGVLLDYLDRDLFDISLVRINERSDDGEVPADIEQFTIEAQPDAVGFAEGSPVAELLGRYADELTWTSSVALGLSSLLEWLDADVVIAQGFYAAIISTMAKQRAGATTVTLASMHSRAHDFANTAYGGDLYAALIQEYLGAADRVIAPFESIGDDLIQKLGVPAEGVSILPDPVDAGAARRRSLEPPVEHPWFALESPVFLCVAEAGCTDGMTYLLQALAFARQHEPIRCLIAGCGDAARELEDHAARLGVSHSVAFLGEADAPWGLMAGSAAVIHASARSETNIPEAVIDAVAAGRPVISTRSSDALCEFLGQGERGVLVQMKDAQSLADAMLQIVWDEEAGQEMARKAGVYLESVSADVVVPRLQEIIRDSIAGAG